MGPLDHAFMLQHMLTTTPFEGVLASIISILLGLLAAFLSAVATRAIPSLFRKTHRSPLKIHKIFRHPLQEAFANGILNSKAF